LKGNTEYQVKIIVHNGLIRYFIDDELYWEMKDEKPLTEGFFGFRTTMSHQQFDNFMVFEIE
jgi:rhamnogalacturonan endolyase